MSGRCLLGESRSLHPPIFEGKMLSNRASSSSSVLCELKPGAAQVVGYPLPQHPQLATLELAGRHKQSEEQRKRDMMIPADDAIDVASLEALGVPVCKIAELSRSHPEFGPFSGISDARRLLRAIKYGLQRGTPLEVHLLSFDDLWS